MQSDREVLVMRGFESLRGVIIDPQRGLLYP